MTALQRLLDTYAVRGHRARAVPVARLRELREETEAPAAHASVAPEVRERYLPDGFDYDLDRDSRWQTVVIVATPSPQSRLTFHRAGGPVPVRLGPGYVDRAEILRAVKAVAAEVLEPAGHGTAPVALPKKLLAARAGLGRYGRNNLLYVHGMGSFHRLTAFATDARGAAASEWQEPRLLERCDRCTACLWTCPTGAIGRDRFLLHAERCLAFFNEKPLALPAWVDPGWHESLVGCTRCQRLCPENRDLRDRIHDAGEFDDAETAALLEAAAPEALPDPLREKLAALALLSYAPVLSRNLRALLGAAGPA